MATPGAIAAQVAAGLAAAHESNIVHRDLKPSNIFLQDGDSRDDEDPRFGVSLLEVEQRGQKTRTGSTLGTPAYMAPEQARGDRDVDGGRRLGARARDLRDAHQEPAVRQVEEPRGSRRRRRASHPEPRRASAERRPTADPISTRALVRDKAARLSVARRGGPPRGLSQSAVARSDLLNPLDGPRTRTHPGTDGRGARRQGRDSLRRGTRPTQRGPTISRRWSDRRRSSRRSRRSNIERRSALEPPSRRRGWRRRRCPGRRCRTRRLRATSASGCT